MPAPSILVIVVDGLRASALGAYGNTSISTPALDHFASSGLLLDWCFAPSAELADIYRALWQSTHPARPIHAATSASLPRALAANGYATILVTDEPQLTAIAAASDFDQCLQLHDSMPIGAPIERANDVSHTSMARLFGSTCDLISSPVQVSNAKSPLFIWTHSRGMYGPWDAPLELQQSLLDEGDPPPVQSTALPDLMISPSDDPDVAFRFASAYAAQTLVLDECWDGVLQTLATAADSDDWIVVLIGARGFPLGEHRHIGGIDLRLYSEQLHVPWIIRLPGGLGRLARSGLLTTHLDLMPTLLGAIGQAAANAAPALDGSNALPLVTHSRPAWRAELVAKSEPGDQVVRTADWCLRLDARSSTGGELYVRPDDRWEANDVAKLCPDVVESLANTMNEALNQISGSDPRPRGDEVRDESR
jgi:arylsulfatase A-like enzyme